MGKPNKGNPDCGFESHQDRLSGMDLGGRHLCRSIEIIRSQIIFIKLNMKIGEVFEDWLQLLILRKFLQSHKH